VGESGIELWRILGEVGIKRADCRVSNLVNFQPPRNDFKFFAPKGLSHPEHFHPLLVQGLEELKADLENWVAKRPGRLIIACGGRALWALTGHDKIMAWRGSQLTVEALGGTRLMPILHPAAIIRQWVWRTITVCDLSRAVEAPWTPPVSTYTINPTFREVKDFLVKCADQTVAVDIETDDQRDIACIAVAAKPREAICIPWSTDGKPRWSLEEELRIRELLTALGPVIGQNFAYDHQYLSGLLYWSPRVRFDTLIAQHVLLPGTPKDLGYLSSQWCRHHVQWKHEDARNLKTPIPGLWPERALLYNVAKGDAWPERRWRYNCKDAGNTMEIAVAQRKAIEQAGLAPQFAEMMGRLERYLGIMYRGIRIDTKRRRELKLSMLEEIGNDEGLLSTILLGVPKVPRAAPWYRSPVQQKKIFYDLFRVQPVMVKYSDGYRPGLDGDALETILKREPALGPLINTLLSYRNKCYIFSHLLEAGLEPDKRMRCFFNPAGAETFRLSSSTNAFGRGTNLQNIEKKYRKLFIPDPGRVLCEVDLEGADLQVVAWEARDEELKAILRARVDVHTENAKLLFGASAQGDPVKRHLAKSWVHGTNYGGTPWTMARFCGITVHEAEGLQRRWFSAHPGIPDWHTRVRASLDATRSVANRFGYRIIYLGRVDSLLPEALAWIPQSTVAILTDKWMQNLEGRKATLPFPVELLLQVHDSIVFQIPTLAKPELLLPCFQTPVPYEDPLVIPVSFSTSSSSWGDMEKIEIR
jgi:DNA polymerase I-like protein with 3'-5' exonuclease and polymerase domains